MDFFEMEEFIFYDEEAKPNTFIVTCPSCGTELKVESAEEGQVELVECCDCGEAFRVE